MKRQKGAALLLAILGLVLITAIALGMLFASDTETNISVNYRDKQVALYAALSGLQEARTRIHPCQGDLGKGTAGDCLTGGLNLVPTALPVSTAPNVLYIINPGKDESASDVKPWDPANKYFDAELCQENIPGLCNGSSPASGNSWYHAYYNNSNSTVWQIKDTSGNPAPLPYKWVRVQLKSDNSTPITVGNGAGKQVCWDGAHEQQMQANYHTDCTPPNDGVTNIAVTNPGTGYSPGAPPTVTITGGSGAGATATATVERLPEGVTSVTLTDGGAGYGTSTPNVAIISADGNGAGALATANMSGGNPVTAVNLQNGNPPACYPSSASASSFSVSFNPSGATGSVTALAPGKCIYSATASGTCSKNTTYTVTSSSGGFSATVSFGTNKNSPGTPVVTSPGNFSGLSGVTFTNSSGSGSCAGLTLTPIAGQQIQSITGSGGTYMSTPGVAISGPVAIGGSTTATATLGTGAVPGKVARLNLVTGGSGYTTNPTVVIDPPPAGAGVKTATGTASITPEYGVTGITITNAGHGYTSSNPPTVTIGPPTGSGSQATAVATVGSGGTYQGVVYLLTSFAQTSTGARSMAQMEVGVTYDQFKLSLGGALNLPGPRPTFGTPSSQNFKIIGTDCPTCGPQPSGCNTTPLPAKPAIGVYDDPNHPTDPTSVATVISALGKPNNYIGAHAAPDVENAFASWGDPTPAGLNAFVDSVRAVATNRYGSNPSFINPGTAANPAIDVIDGNYTMGPTTGYGILVVTGTLTFHGDYGWNGLILVIGSGASIMNGGGNGQINGSVLVANTTGTTLGSPVADWAGGGGNGIQYNHCWADDMLAKVPFTPSPNSKALKVISLRMLQN